MFPAELSDLENILRPMDEGSPAGWPPAQAHSNGSYTHATQGAT